MNEEKNLIINEITDTNKDSNKNDSSIIKSKEIHSIELYEGKTLPKKEKNILNSIIKGVLVFIFAFIIIIKKFNNNKYNLKPVLILRNNKLKAKKLNYTNNNNDEIYFCKLNDPFKSFYDRLSVKPIEVCKSSKSNHICYQNNINQYIVKRGVICQMENVVIDPSKWKADGFTFHGPVNNKTRGCPILSHGFFNMDCETRNNISRYDAIYNVYFDSWNYNYNISEKLEELAPGKFVFFVSRNQDSPNLYFGGGGIINALSMIHHFKIDPKDIQVVFLESMVINNDPYYDFYKLMISRGGEPIHIRDLHKKYLISKAIHVPINWDTPCFVLADYPQQCKYQSKAFYYLNKYIDEYMNISKFTEPVNYDNETFYYSKTVNDPNSKNYTKFLTFQWRKAWPRGRKGQGRLIGNGPEIVEELTEKLPKNILVRLVDTASLTMKEQISLMRKTDYYLGVHGAGLFLSVFLPTTSILHEISLKRKTNNLLFMSRLSGHKTFCDIFNSDVYLKEIDGSEFIFFKPENVSMLVFNHMKETKFFSENN